MNDLKSLEIGSSGARNRRSVAGALKALYRGCVIGLARPYIRRELPGWGAFYRSLVGSHKSAPVDASTGGYVRCPVQVGIQVIGDRRPRSIKVEDFETQVLKALLELVSMPADWKDGHSVFMQQDQQA
jgi:hypothetical protein